MRSSRITMAAGAVLALALAASACGHPGSHGSAGSTQTTTVKVGVLPIMPVAPLYLGMQQGLFQEEGIHVEPKTAQGGAAIVPSVVSGEWEFGFSNVASVMLARLKGLPVKIVAKGSQSNAGASRDFGAVIVPEESRIHSAQDLRHATIAVNTLRNIGTLTIKVALEKKGADLSTIKFTEIPFSNINGALRKGRVDAAWQEEPFLTKALAQDARIVLQHYRTVDPNLTVAAYFTRKRTIKRRPEVVHSFRQAMNRSLKYAENHPKEAREVVRSYTDISKEVVGRMTLAGWGPDLNVATIKKLARLGVKQDLFERRPDVDQLLYQPKTS